MNTTESPCLMAKLVKAVLLTNVIAAAAQAQTTESNHNGIGPVEDEMLIVGQRAQRSSKGATGLNLDVFNTPQSVVLIDRDFLDTFVLDDVSTALRFANGVNVESVETERTSFNARGFDIKSMQVDGVGIPFTWQLNGSLDTAIYEKVEIIRGANGLLTGTGTPSGTINYVRKRPTNDFTAYTELTANSYSGKRFEGDVSLPFNDSGSWAGRFVGVASDEKSWVDRYENDRALFYAIVDGQLSDSAIVTVGYSDHKSESSNPLWGALPVVYADGTPTDYDVSASNSMDWTFWNTHNQTAFAELLYQLSMNWDLKTVVTSTHYEENQETVWFGGLPDRNTGLGQYGWPGGYGSESDTLLYDLVASGSISLMGRDHELVLGISDSTADYFDTNKSVPPTHPIWGSAPAFINGYHGNEIPRPPFSEPFEVSDWTYELQRVYGAARINPADSWKIILGFNDFEMKSDGYAYDEPMDASESQFSPYAGVIWSVTSDTNLYLSYSDIFEPQTELDINGTAVGPAKGINYELGAKTEFADDQLLLSVALFRAEQQNYAEWVGWDAATGVSFYAGNDIESEGVEVDVFGYITHNWKLQAGYASVDLSESDGTKRTYLPEQTLKLLSSYQLSERLSVGVSLRWQDEMYYVSANTNTRVSQDAYALLGLNLSYDFNDSMSLDINVDNLTDEKYHNSYYWADIYAWDQAYYGAPRNGKVRFTVKW